MKKLLELLSSQGVFLDIVQVLNKLPKDLIFELLGRAQDLLLLTYLVPKNAINNSKAYAFSFPLLR